MLSQNPKEKTFGGLRQIVVAGFASIGLLISLDEIFDLPHFFLGAPATPINWAEIGIEFGLILLIGWLCVRLLSVSETRRRQAEMALAAEKERLAVTLRSIGDGVIATDVDGQIVLINETAEDLTGWTQEEAIGKPLSEIFHIINEKTRKRCENPVEKVFETGGIVGLANDTVLVAKDGTERVIADSGAPIRDENGNVIGVVLVFRDVTEQRRAQQALRETRNYLENLLDHANAPIIVWDTGSKITKFNHAFEHLTGYAAEEVIGQELRILFPEASRDESLRRIERTLSGEYWESVEIPILRKDGDTRIALWNSANIYIEDGKTLLATIAQGQDITDRKHAEEALRESEEKFRLMVSEVKDYAILMLDPEGRISSWNEGAQHIKGYSSEEIIGEHFSRFYTKEDIGASKPDEELKEAIARGRFEDEGWRVRKDGSRFLANVVITALRDETGELKGFTKVTRDITERKQAEEELEKHRHHLEELVEERTAQLKATNEQLQEEITERKLAEEALEKRTHELGERVKELNCLYRASKLLAETGKPLEEVFQGIADLIPPSWQYPAITCARITFEGQQFKTDNFNETAWKQSADTVASGEKIASVEVYYLREKPLAYEGPFLKEERELTDALAREIGKFAERQRMQERLVSSEKLAVLGQLAGGVGHELRNPLGAIKNAAYFLNMAIEEPEPEVKETLEILDNEVATSERIISSLLGFARPKPPSLRKVDINNLVQDILPSVSVPENVEVATELQSLPAILADPDQLGQVFGNILSNGIQAMSQGGRLVIKSGTRDPGWVTVSIIDTGMGMPEEVKSKVFEPLFTTKAKGIGLGLAVSRTLVEGNGGTIEVESKVGEGSTFTLRLPIGGEEKELHE